MESTSQTNQLILHSSSSSLPRKNYDVFLSFRGEDTRKSFTDHLFAALCRAGVYTFRDAEELRKGEDISTDLFSAIQESMVSIIVFSKTYASSRWCLEEVVKIVECKEKAKQVVLPVFYDVDPSEVRNQTGEFGVALALHQQRFGTEKVSQWKTTLTKVANFSGWDLRNIADGYESTFIDNIVENVLQVVNPTYFDVPKYLVGIHARVKEVLSLLKSEADGDVRMIGIYGMGGVGKTTLAKAVFNQIYRSFDGSCFLGDVRQECVDRGCVGLQHLQEKLLSETLNGKRLKVDHVDQGISLIKRRLGLKKVFIVVDDVEDKSQLDALVGERDWFGPGSRIIITTRNVDFLNGLRRDCEKYNVEVLSLEESLQLFSWHAFKKPSPEEAFMELSNMIVSYVSGLPLALTTLGSHFWTRSSIQEWIDDFEKLRRIPHNDIFNILKISYDALDDDTQRIFLDIACFFTHEKGYIIEILNGCGFYAQSGIRTLIGRYLLEKSLSMHDLVRDMGREIVRKESPMQPEKRSRLFLADEVSDVLTNNKGTDAIETMIIKLSNEVPLSSKVFSKMTKLRALKILDMNVKGSLKYLSKELRFLYWHGCLLSRISSDLCLEKLVILKIQESNIKEFQPKLQNFRCLQSLWLESCKKLKRAPNFVGAHSLKELYIDGCSKLVKLPKSIGDLKNLNSLYLKGCKNLNALRSSICNLKSLKLLVLQGCSKIKELPQSIGDLENLVALYLSNCKNLNVLPSSICNLKSLTRLNLESCSKVKELPQSIGDLENLVELCLSNCEDLNGLPDSICNLKSLKDFVLHGCSKIKELPQSIGDLENLIELNLSNCKDLNALPSSICNLKSLTHLDLKWCSKIKELPQSIGDLENLVGLYLSNCEDLNGLPDSICNLKSLKDFVLRGCSKIKELPQSIGDLENLVMLNLSNCKDLNALPSSICNLKSLTHLILQNCLKIKELPIDLGKLKLLNFHDASMTSVTYVSTSCGSLRHLKCLKLVPHHSAVGGHYNERCIGHLEFPNTNLLCSYEMLSAPYQYMQHLDLKIGDERLSLLTWLDLSYSDFDTLPFNLSHLSNLQGLHLGNCPNLSVIKDDDLPLSLYSFTVYNCPLLKSIQDVSGLLRLEELYLGGCSNLNEVVGVENLVNLKDMNIRGCSALSSKYWCDNWFKALFKRPTLTGWVRMRVSKDMVPQYWRRSKQVDGVGVGVEGRGRSWKNKRIFIVVMVSCLLDPWILYQQETNGRYGIVYGSKDLGCCVYELPNKVEEGEVLIEFCPKDAEENSSVETCIVYEEEGEVCFFPINPNKVLKFQPPTFGFVPQRWRSVPSIQDRNIVEVILTRR
ncbi:PREDICTED: disease resistance protein TAO1-like [Ipomoea nil]|uniref:disease resistance protein TAO1-like n=1 Tax=Ipomoea nil TaxID=35883 RepID=UPI000900C92F|nr:PREDICTED: disease resistance protein TAO1-like [Ipomoea nil]